MTADPRLPVAIEREVLVWQPVPGRPALTIDVQELLRPIGAASKKRDPGTDGVP